MKQLPLPAHYNPNKFVPDGHELYVKYNELEASAKAWASQHGIPQAATDKVKVCAMPIDMQLTFCDPASELPVLGAMDDCKRAAEFVYRDIGNITHFAPTFDTHLVMQIFHSIMLVDDHGNHPQPGTPDSVITEEQVKTGKWHINPAVAAAIAKGNLPKLERHLAHYTKMLKQTGKEALITWPYHAMLGGIGHAMVPVLEEAIRFHQFARQTEIDPRIKGGNPLTENYSVIQPNVLTGPDGEEIDQKNPAFLAKLLAFDMLIIFGEAKSHCLLDSVNDILQYIMTKDRSLADKVYILEDCTSPVVIVPGDPYLDFTPKADAGFQKFADAGIHIVQSTTPMWEWPDSPVPEPSVQAAVTV